MPNMFTVSKDGESFYDMEDTPENREGADKKGYTPYLDMTKDGKDHFTLPATKENVDGAVAKGYVTVDAFKNRGAPKADAITKSDSALRGAAQGASFGLADEGTGAAEAAGKTLFGDEKLADLPANYAKHRDESRANYKAAQEANPMSYLGGELGGGIASGIATGGVGAGIKGAAALGALQGFGAGEGDLSDQALSTAKGAGIGAAAGAVGKLFTQGGRDTVRAAGRGAKEGAQQAYAEGTKIPLVQASENAIGALKGMINGVKEHVATGQEVESIAKQARVVLHADSQSGAVGNLSNDEAILAAAMQDGENPVKDWLSKKSAMLNPGNGSSEDYSKLLNMSSEDRAAARAFNARDTAKELVPDVENTQKLFTKARGERFNQLQDDARSSFDGSGVDDVVREVNDGLQDAHSLPIYGGKVKSALGAVKTMLEDGIGARSHGLTEGHLYEQAPDEMFNRLQKSREVLDEAINYSSNKAETESVKLLKQTRDKIDDALKTSPDKVDADAIYSQGKRVEDNFFNATEFKKNGQVDIDEGKIARLLGGTDQAKRFQASLQQAKEYANTPGLSDEFRQQMGDLAAKMEQKIGVADNQRAINTFRYKAGPSSPAIERMQSALGKNDLLKDAVNAPAGFLNSMDEFKKYVAERTGQPYSKMSPDQQLGVTKFWTWMKGNQGASESAANKAWTKFVGSTPNQKDF
ncbi:MAG: hypothetical protein H0U76_21700 [Ktedonobacteraceae bacterium]|nr:hypothetical protein [Ktedonobacteraceae bacterium]